MKEIKETCYKGTRILLGNRKRQIISKMIDTLNLEGFQEISIPIIQFQETFKNKVGKENNNLMFNFKDRGDRNVCLAPEYTAIIQKLSTTTFKGKKDVKLFYIQECFRGENPQAGRYRQFTQLGVEILNPTQDYNSYLSFLAYHDLLRKIFDKTDFKLHKNVTRGLDYYKEGKGFEITCSELGSSKQICGGGEYDGGIGFAIGIDRLLMLDLPPLGAAVSPVAKGDTIDAAEFFYCFKNKKDMILAIKRAGIKLQYGVGDYPVSYSIYNDIEINSTLLKLLTTIKRSEWMS